MNFVGLVVAFLPQLAAEGLKYPETCKNAGAPLRTIQSCADQHMCLNRRHALFCDSDASECICQGVVYCNLDNWGPCSECNDVEAARCWLKDKQLGYCLFGVCHECMNNEACNNKYKVVCKKKQHCDGCATENGCIKIRAPHCRASDNAHACEVMCARPHDLASNVEATETNLAQVGFNVTLKCKTGFTGSPSAEACSEVDAYTVTGFCDPIMCARPQDLASNVEATETNLGQVGFDVTLKCKTGFMGSPSAEACGEDDAYTVTGFCDPITCTRPVDLASNIEAIETTLTRAGFNVTLKCKTGFMGSPSAEACSEDDAYTVTGVCDPVTCSRPNDIASNVEATEITLTQKGFNVTLRCKPGFMGSLSAEACSEDGAYTVTGICHPEAATTTTPSKSTTVPIAANTANTVLSTSAAISTSTNTTSTATTTTPTRTTSTTTVSSTITTTTTSATTTSTTATIATTTATPATITTTPTSTRSAATSSSTAASATSTATAATTTIISTPATATLTTRAAPATTTTATNNAVTKAVTSSTSARSIRITTTTLATDLAGCSSRTGCNGIDVSTGTATHKPTTSFTPTGAAQPRWVTWLIVVLAIDAFAFLLCLVGTCIYPNHAADLYRRLAAPMRCFCGKNGNEDTQEGFCEEDPAIANMEGLQANYNISGHKAMLPVSQLPDVGVVATTKTCNRSTPRFDDHHLDMKDGQATKRSSTRSALSANYSMDNAIDTCQNKMPQFGYTRKSPTLGIQDVTVRTSFGKELLQPSSDSLNPTVSDRVVPDPFCGVSNEAPIEQKYANDRSDCPPGTSSRHSTTRAGN